MDESFEDIAARAGTPVGEAELIQRRMIGDARYEEVQAHNDAMAEAALDQALRATDALRALTFQRYAVGVAAIVAVAIAWSVALAWIAR
jgi:hypothetical protein